MTHEGRPHDVQTALQETTNPSLDLNRSVARGDRSVAVVSSAFARTWQVLAACRRDLEMIERHRENAGHS